MINQYQFFTKRNRIPTHAKKGKKRAYQANYNNIDQVGIQGKVGTVFKKMEPDPVGNGYFMSANAKFLIYSMED